MMSQMPNSQSQVHQNSYPAQMLQQLSESKTSGLLKASCQSVDWYFYFDIGQLIFANNTVAPGDRLDRHLRRLTHETETLTRQICLETEANFKSNFCTNLFERSDYQIIAYLIKNKFIKLADAATLLRRISIEVIESYLLVASEQITQEFIPQKSDSSRIPCQFDLNNLLEESHKRVKRWKSMTPYILTPDQRPYFVNNTYAQQNLQLKHQQKLSKLLRGFSFRHIGALLNQDELALAVRLYPLIKNQAILLREPQHPFEQLPKFSAPAAEEITQQPAPEQIEIDKNTFIGQYAETIQKHWKIVCVDDSQTILNEISRYLGTEEFEVHTINESVKALMQIMTIKPDLVLLDVGMPGLDGYQLCSLLRKSPLFKTTPLVMVTANTGIIDRAKARLAGATDYMTKPFNQMELLKMVFRYLT